MKTKTKPHMSTLLKVFIALVIIIVLPKESYGEDDGIGAATTNMAGLITQAYKFLTVIVALGALVFAMQALGQIKQGRNEGWTKLMSIVLVVAIWLFAIPPFINRVGGVSGSAPGITAPANKTL